MGAMLSPVEVRMFVDALYSMTSHVACAEPQLAACCLALIQKAPSESNVVEGTAQWGSLLKGSLQGMSLVAAHFCAHWVLPAWQLLL